MKRNFDWKLRRQQLQDLCDRFRSSDLSYDVLVPGSGGKDSIYVSEILRTEFGMTHLLSRGRHMLILMLVGITCRRGNKRA